MQTILSEKTAKTGLLEQQVNYQVTKLWLGNMKRITIEVRDHETGRSLYRNFSVDETFPDVQESVEEMYEALLDDKEVF